MSVGTKQPNVAFVDLAAQRRRIGDAIERGIAQVLEHGQFVLGPEVGELERRLQEFCGAKHCITCANGTDALELVLMAEGMGPGDAVIVPAFTFSATAEAVSLCGATPVFADVLDGTFAIDPASLKAAVDVARKAGLRPRAVIAVDLYGQPADYGRREAVAETEKLLIIADAAQSFGARRNGRAVGTLAAYTTTSFYPSKPLGCYGDGGAIFTNDDGAAQMLRELRCHGQSGKGNPQRRIGMNSRLDTLQAAILLAKLDVLPMEIEARQQVASRYSKALQDVVKVPTVSHGVTSVWAQYALLIESGRNQLAADCRKSGVPTAIHYEHPLHRLPAYAPALTASEKLPRAEWLAERVLCLPMHADLDAETQDRIVAGVSRGLQSLKASSNNDDLA